MVSTVLTIVRRVGGHREDSLLRNKRENNTENLGRATVDLQSLLVAHGFDGVGSAFNDAGIAGIAEGNVKTR